MICPKNAIRDSKQEIRGKRFRSLYIYIYIYYIDINQDCFSFSHL